MPFRRPPRPGSGPSDAGNQPDDRRIRLRPERPSEPLPAAPDAPAAVPGRRLRRRARLTLATALGALLFVGLNLAAAVPGRAAPEAAWSSPLRAALARLRGPVRIGLQVGHLDAADQPAELASLRASTGAHAGGVDEVDVNRAVVLALAARLRARGFTVDVLPATVPPGYRADLVLAVHADASADPEREGYKSAHFLPARNAREPLLKLAIDRAVLLRGGLGDDDRNVSGNMLRYYAFNRARFRHAVSRRTPSLLVELGYLSNPHDLRLLERPDRVASLLERGVLTYLRDVGRIPADGG